MTNFEAKIYNHIVIPFLNGIYEDVQYIGSYYCTDGKILINNEVCFTNTKKGIVIEALQEKELIVAILNLLPNVWGSLVKDGSIFINGIEWDGKKCNLELFEL